MYQNTFSDYFPANYQFNLSDFALFLSVMKNKRAYECTLSIILDEPDIQLREVKVEQVILNHSGKQTRYRQLPSTVIIFITQDDIFKKDLAKYTFTEQCEEVTGLHLEDGTTKIFLNMTSHNGSQELISLLQYMKETRIDNPNILVKDSRILELNQIVQEVKESDEWEAVKMNILEVGIEKGRSEGIEKGRLEGLEKGRSEGELLKLISQIKKKYQKGYSIPEIADALEEPEASIRPVFQLIEKHPDLSVEALLEYLAR